MIKKIGVKIFHCQKKNKIDIQTKKTLIFNISWVNESVLNIFGLTEYS